MKGAIGLRTAASGGWGGQVEPLSLHHSAAAARASGSRPKEGRVRGLGTSTPGPPGEQAGQGKGHGQEAGTARGLWQGLCVDPQRTGALKGLRWSLSVAEMRNGRRRDPRLWMPGVRPAKGPAGGLLRAAWLGGAQLSPAPPEGWGVSWPLWGESRAALGHFRPCSSQGSMNRLLWPVNRPFINSGLSVLPPPGHRRQRSCPGRPRAAPGKHLDGELVRRAPREPPHGPGRSPAAAPGISEMLRGLTRRAITCLLLSSSGKVQSSSPEEPGPPENPFQRAVWSPTLQPPPPPSSLTEHPTHPQPPLPSPWSLFRGPAQPSLCRSARHHLRGARPYHPHPPQHTSHDPTEPLDRT